MKKQKSKTSHNKRKSKNTALPFYILLFILMISAVIAVFVRYSTTDSTDINQYENAVTRQFIEDIAEDAQAIGEAYNIYSSVLIAQAVLESESGTSALSAAPHHNLFGIKGTYNGSSVSFETYEDDGQGNLYTITDEFRSYPSRYASMDDYAQLMRSLTYQDLWKENTFSYRDATATLTGLYATDTDYDKKLNALIQEYNLTQYDK